jgi:hypothetical protein
VFERISCKDIFEFGFVVNWILIPVKKWIVSSLLFAFLFTTTKLNDWLKHYVEQLTYHSFQDSNNYEKYNYQEMWNSSDQFVCRDSKHT